MLVSNGLSSQGEVFGSRELCSFPTENNGLVKHAGIEDSGFKEQIAIMADPRNLDPLKNSTKANGMTLDLHQGSGLGPLSFGLPAISSCSLFSCTLRYQGVACVAVRLGFQLAC